MYFLLTLTCRKYRSSAKISAIFKSNITNYDKDDYAIRRNIPLDYVLLVIKSYVYCFINTIYVITC